MKVSELIKALERSRKGMRVSISIPREDRPPVRLNVDKVFKDLEYGEETTVIEVGIPQAGDYAVR